MNKVHLHNKYHPAMFRCADHGGFVIEGRGNLEVRYSSSLFLGWSNWMDQEVF